ncbi:hypothetical protein RIF29_10903 [Crotalaria pallida]|uniref:F-box domain-containing protein n=1 Tax=Crotalaria pallida TaxID=3830 RepID=A0AAN9FWH4_CROPI
MSQNMAHMSILKDAMEPETKRRRPSESEGNEDRLSDLPECVLLHILSLMQGEEVVRTCVLSARWKHLWKCLPRLVLHSSDFTSVKIFCKFVTKFLAHCDESVGLDTLDFQRRGSVELRLLRRVVSHAIARNVQHLRIHTTTDIDKLPRDILFSIFSCQSLASLNLSVFHNNILSKGIVFPESPNLPALTSLHLQNFAFCATDNDVAEPFSTLKKLNNLAIDDCTLKDAQILCISSDSLKSFTIFSKNPRFYKIELSAPRLSYFAFNGVPRQHISGSSLSSLQQVKVDASIHNISSEQASIVLNWLRELANVQSLTVTANTLQILFLIPDLLNIKLSSLVNLKSLKVEMKPLSYAFAWEAKMNIYKPTVPDGVVEFLLQNSPSAKVSMIK